MPENLKDKTVLWIDNGLFHGFAKKIAPCFKKNFYYTPWQSGFPSQRQTRLGAGFPELTRVNYAKWRDPKAGYDLADVDLFIFMDLFQRDWQADLMAQGKRVWGAGDAEDVELDRVAFRAWCERNGFPQTPGVLVSGVDALRKELAKHQDAFVKLAEGMNRGDMETWNWKGERLSTLQLNDRIHALGSFGADTRFIVEPKVKDVIELGEDGLNVRGQWPDHLMQGMEVKGLGTIGIVKPYAQLPECLRKFNAKLAEVFEGDRASTFFCMEGLYTEARKYYPMDACIRLGSPSNELLACLFSPESWARCLWDGAEGKLTSLKPVAKYGIVTMVYNENSGNDFQPMSYPKEVEPWMFLRNPYAMGKERYAVPQGSPTNLAGVVGIGNTLLEAATAMGRHARMIDGNQLEIATDSLLKMLDIIKTSNKWGATFTTDPLPSVDELKKAIG